MDDETKQLNVRIPEWLYDDLRTQSERLGIPVTRITIDALKVHLKKLDKMKGY